MIDPQLSIREDIHSFQIAQTRLQHVVCHLLHNPISEALVENAIRAEKETIFSIYLGYSYSFHLYFDIYHFETVSGPC